MGKYGKQYLGLIIGIIAIVITNVMAVPAGLTVAGWKTLGLMIFCIAIWVANTFPIGIGATLGMVMIHWLGIAGFGATLANFMKTATWFVVAAFAISCGLSETPLAKRLLRALVRISGTKTERVIFALMLATAIISTIMSNIPTCAMMMAVGYVILNGMDAKPGESRMGRVLMIGIPIAAMCGGIVTPAGSSVNVIGVELLKAAGYNITFFQWMMYGVPCMIVLLPIGWWTLLKIFKPEPIPAEVVEKLMNPEDVQDKWTPAEKKSCIIIVLTLIFWILGSWIPVLDMTAVATMAMVAFFLPGMNVYSFKQFTSSISWDAILTVGGVMCLGGAVASTGLGQWMVDTIFAGVTGWHPLVFLLFVSLVVNFIHLILPTAPAVCTIILPPMMAVAVAAGFSPLTMCFMVACMAGCVMLLPVDTLTVMTYATGYFTIPQLFKVGLINSLCWSVMMAVVPYIVSVVLKIF